jgi:hypothetical protein
MGAGGLGEWGGGGGGLKTGITNKYNYDELSVAAGGGLIGETGHREAKME